MMELIRLAIATVAMHAVISRGNVQDKFVVNVSWEWADQMLKEYQKRRC